MRIGGRRALAAVLVATAAGVGHADEATHRYKDAEPIKLWANKIGPYNNPQETYNYFALPFCSDDDLSNVEHKWGGLGEVLEGNDLVNSGLDMSFKVDRTEPVTLCSIKLDAESVRRRDPRAARARWRAPEEAPPPRRAESGRARRVRAGHGSFPRPPRAHAAHAAASYAPHRLCPPPLTAPHFLPTSIGGYFHLRDP